MAILPLIGPSYKSEAQDNNYRECLNMYLVEGGPNARSKVAMVRTSGLLEVADLVGSQIRGLIAIDGIIYAVVDDRVYYLTINVAAKTSTTPVLLGTITTDTGPVKFSRNPTQLILVDGSDFGYIITLATNTMAVIADSHFLGATHVVFCDGYFIYNEPNTAFLRTSAINDGTSWDPLDVATAESKPDDLVGLAVNKGEIWAFGTDTVEVWYNAANAVGIPFSPRVGSEIDIGCGASGSIVEINNLIMWLDNRGFIVQSQISPYVRNQSSGYDLKIVSNAALQDQIATYTTTSDAIACTYIERGHIMYQITFPTAGKTWVYDQTSEIWFERGTRRGVLSEITQHAVQYVTVVDGMNIVAGMASSKIYIMSREYFDDNGSYIICKWSTGIISDEDNLITINRLKLRLGSGLATPTGDGSNPQITMRYSNDGGHTWSHHLARDIGDIGQYGLGVIWNMLGTAREWQFEFTIVEPINFTIVEGSIDVDVE